MGHKESVSKTGEVLLKVNLQSIRDPLFDEIPEETLDHMEKRILKVGDKRYMVLTRPIVSTDGSKVSTDRQIKGTDEQIEGTNEQRKGTDDHTEEGSVTQTTQPPPTSTIFGDDETIAKLRRSLNSLQVMKRWLGKYKKSGKARIEADRLLTEKLQEEEREQFIIEERAKFLHDTIVAQRKFLAQQISEAIRNRPPTKNQLRNQMMTYLKHVGNFKHSELKTKKFEEIQALYEKIKRSDEDFISIGSAKDERLIKKIE
ncbi:hypothetical protein Tco_0385876 [Tanacetum coccineum]